MMVNLSCYPIAIKQIPTNTVKTCFKLPLKKAKKKQQECKVVVDSNLQVRVVFSKSL